MRPLPLTPSLLFTTLASLLLGFCCLFVDPGYSALVQYTLVFVSLTALVFLTLLARSWLERETLTDLLAAALCVGGTVVAVDGAQQLLSAMGSARFANQQIAGTLIRQPNLYASMLLLGWTATLYLLPALQVRWWRIGGWLLAALVFGCTLPFTGSRTMFINLALLSGLAIAALILGRYQRQKHFGLSLLLAMLLALVSQFTLPPALAKLTGATNRSVLQRVEAAGATASARLRTDEWKKAVQVWQAHPLTGVGTVRFPYHSFVLQQQAPFNEIPRERLYTHPHNLLFEVLAEQGLIGLGLLLGFLWWWSIQQVWQKMDSPRLLGCAGVLILLTHSMLEFPLWYWYFLIPFTLLLALNDDSRWHLRLSVPGSVLLLAPALTLLGWGGYQQWLGTQQINASYHAYFTARNVSQSRQLARPALNNPLLSLDAEMQYSYGDTANLRTLPDTLARNTRLLRWRPFASVVYHRALLLAQAGQLKEARFWLAAGLRNYPKDRGYLENMYVRSEPTPALKAFYAEYQVASQKRLDEIKAEVAAIQRKRAASLKPQPAAASAASQPASR